MKHEEAILTDPDNPDHYLQPGRFIDSDSAEVRDYTDRAVANAIDPVEQAVRLFRTVRDGIHYDPYTISTNPADYRASAISARERAWCVPKAVLLTATARAAGIPARIGFADVRNHLQTDRLRERMNGADLFIYHGYSEMWLEGRWVKATPAFNMELCQRFGIQALNFDGRHDALLHEYTTDGHRHMEYVRDRGSHADLPLEELLAAMTAAYGPQIVKPLMDPTVDRFRP